MSYNLPKPLSFRCNLEPETTTDDSMVNAVLNEGVTVFSSADNEPESTTERAGATEGETGGRESEAEGEGRGGREGEQERTEGGRGAGREGGNVKH